MRAQLLFFLLYFASLSIYTQSVSLNIESIKMANDSLLIELIIQNISERDIVLYDFQLDDICYGIFILNMIESDTQKKYLLFPCEGYAADLDEILYSEKNTVQLTPLSILNKKLVVDVHRFSPKLKHKTNYILQLKLSGLVFPDLIKCVNIKDVNCSKVFYYE